MSAQHIVTVESVRAQYVDLLKSNPTPMRFHEGQPNAAYRNQVTLFIKDGITHEFVISQTHVRYSQYRPSSRTPLMRAIANRH